MAKKAETAAEKAEKDTRRASIDAKHYALISQAKERLESAQGSYRATIKAAKNDGVPTAALLAAMREKKMDPDAIALRDREMVRMRALVGVPMNQLDMFSALQPEQPKEAAEIVSEADADAAGFSAYNGGAERGDNLHKPGTMLYQAWDRGWLRGQEETAGRMGGGESKAASARKSRAKPKPEPASEDPKPAAQATSESPKPKGKRKTAAEALASAREHLGGEVAGEQKETMIAGSPMPVPPGGIMGAGVVGHAD